MSEEEIIDKKYKEKDCYTPLLHQYNLNTVDMTKEGKHNAFIYTLSIFLNMKHDDHKKSDMIQQRFKYSILSFCAICGIVLLCLLLNFTVPKTKYFSDYVTYWGVPKGLFPLTAKQIKPLAEHYEITYQFNKPIKLVHANSAHIPIPETEILERFNRPMIAEYTYKKKLSLSKSIKDWQLLKSAYTTQTFVMDDLPRNNVTILDYHPVFDESGKITNMMSVDFRYGYGDHVSKALSNDFLASTNMYDTDITKIFDEEPEKQLLEQTSAIYRYQIIYTSEGLEKEVKFCNKAGQSVYDKNKILGFTCEYELNGRLARIDLSYNENTIDKLDFIQSIVYKYSGQNLTSVEYRKGSWIGSNFKEKTQPIVMEFMDNDPPMLLEEIENDQLMMNDSRNISLKQMEYYDSGNIKTISFFDEKGQPAFSMGYSKYIYTYDENTGFVLTLKVIKQNETFLIEKKCDKKYNSIEETLYIDDLYSAQLLMNYDNKRRITSFKLLDAEKKFEKNIHIEYQDDKEIMTFFDDSGNEQKENINNLVIQTFDANRRLVNEYYELPLQKLSLTGTISYNENNTTIHYSYDKKTITDDDFITYSHVEFTYDAPGNLTRVLFKDEAGKPYLSNLGFSEYVASYSPNGLKLRESYLGVDNLLASHPILSGYAKYEALNDLSDTYLTSGKYLNNNGDLTYPKNQEWSWFSTIYPDKESRITTYYHSDNRIYKTITYQNEKIINKTTYKYEENGDYSVISSDGKNKLVFSAFYDVNNRLKEQEDKSYSKRVVLYTKDGESEISDFNQNEQLISILYRNKEGKAYKYKAINEDKSYSFVYLNDKERYSRIEDFTFDNIQKDKMTFEYAEDDSFIINYKDCINTTIKRTLYYNKDSYSLLPLSGEVIRVIEVTPNTQAEKLGFKLDDILLEFIDFKYFDNQTDDGLVKALASHRDEKRKVMVYRPSTKEILNFECGPGVIGIRLMAEFPFPTGDECLTYIAQIKALYNKNL